MANKLLLLFHIICTFDYSLAFIRNHRITNQSKVTVSEWSLLDHFRRTLLKQFDQPSTEFFYELLVHFWSYLCLVSYLPITLFTTYTRKYNLRYANEIATMTWRRLDSQRRFCCLKKNRPLVFHKYFKTLLGCCFLAPLEIPNYSSLWHVNVLSSIASALLPRSRQVEEPRPD